MDPLGHATRLVWNEQGDCLQQTDPSGSITRYGYNARGQLTRYTDCSGYHTTLAYDDRGQLTAITDALSQTTRYHWSESGQLLREELPDGRDNAIPMMMRGVSVASLTAVIKKSPSPAISPGKSLNVPTRRGTVSGSVMIVSGG